LNNQIALGEDRTGDLPKAIEAQERAVAQEKEALAEGATEELQKELERYEKALAAYRQKLGSK
ncbi:MAG: restriction endonuclease subunit S, partial [Holophaga sp.]|nr:restriction endonuclease subunit S [Holophaga sp.]